MRQTYSGTGPALLGASCMPAAASAESGAGKVLAAWVDKAAQEESTHECVVSRSSDVWASGFGPGS